MHELIELMEKIPYPAVNFTKDYDVGSSRYELMKDNVLDFIFETVNKLKILYSFIPELFVCMHGWSVCTVRLSYWIMNPFRAT